MTDDFGENIRRQNRFLFSDKEMYLLTCSDTGKSHAMMSLSPSRRKKQQYNNMHLIGNMRFTESDGFPILKPYNSRIDWDFYPYSMHNKLDGKGQAVYFFEDDYKFGYATWERLENTTYKLSKMDCLLSPDYSLYVDVPDIMNKWNIYKSRFAGAFWQANGFNVIPTASWGNTDSFCYSFEGLPKHSVIAVCGLGVKWCSAATILWEYGMRELEERLEPTNIIVCGEERFVPGIHTPLTFITESNYNKSVNKKWKK